MFRIIIEYNSLRDFWPLGNNEEVIVVLSFVGLIIFTQIIGLFLYEDFWNKMFWLVC